MLTSLEKVLNTLHHRTFSSQFHIRVGVRTNGIPHVGTWLTIASCFVIAKHLQSYCHSHVHIQLLDNSTIGRDNSQYCHGEWECKPAASYTDFLQSLSMLTGIPFTTSTYSQDQKDPTFRRMFLTSLRSWNEFKRLSPLQGFIPGKTAIGVRLCCPKCGLFDKDGSSVRLKQITDDNALFECFCPDHGTFEIMIGECNEAYLNLTTIYRNILKEALASKMEETSLMVKGSDWLFAVLLVDAGLDILQAAGNRPLRIFIPQITTDTGIKLSKTWISEGRSAYQNIDRSLLDMNVFRELNPNSTQRILQLAESILATPKRAITCSEIQKFLGQ